MKTKIPIRILESGKEGKTWKVSLLSEGASQNTYQGSPIYYSKELLEKIVDRFDGIPAYIYQAGDSTFDHLPDSFQEKDGDVLLNKIGWYKDPEVKQINGKSHIVASLTIHEGASSVRDFFKEMWEKGKRIGASIVGDGIAELERRKDDWYAVMQDLVPKSCDPVTNPATDAHFLEIVESQGGTNMVISNKLLELGEELSPDVAEEFEEDMDREDQVRLTDTLIKGLDTEKFSEDLLNNQLSRLREAIATEEDAKAKSILAEIFGEEIEEEESPDSEAEADTNTESENKLQDLMSLLEEGDIEAATDLLQAILNGAYPYPEPEEESTNPEDEDNTEEDNMSEERVEAEETVKELKEEVKELKKDRKQDKAKAKFKESIKKYGLPDPAEARLRKSLFGEDSETIDPEKVEESVEETSGFVDDLIEESDSQVSGLNPQGDQVTAEESGTDVFGNFLDRKMGINKEEDE